MLLACEALDTDPEPEPDHLTAMVSEARDAPVTLVKPRQRRAPVEQARIGFGPQELRRDIASSGPSLTPERLARAFDPFVRVGG